MEDIAEMMMNEERFYRNAYEDGKDKGKNERNIEIAKNLLSEKINIGIIAKATGLTNKQILTLK